LSQADFLQQVGKIVPWDEESRAIFAKCGIFLRGGDFRHPFKR
jgi:hypothetical protein